MKGVISVVFYALVLTATVGSIADANDGGQSGIEAAGPAPTLIASSKKGTPGSSGQSTTDPHLRALELCRQKYGYFNVVNIRIHSDGSVTCYVNFYSPEGKTNLTPRKR